MFHFYYSHLNVIIFFAIIIIISSSSFFFLFFFCFYFRGLTFRCLQPVPNFTTAITGFFSPKPFTITTPTIIIIIIIIINFLMYNSFVSQAVTLVFCDVISKAIGRVEHRS